ncbi:MAG: hypothetical protein NVSMB3_04890 [Acidobacteriaceae bacterium]
MTNRCGYTLGEVFEGTVPLLQREFGSCGWDSCFAGVGGRLQIAQEHGIDAKGLEVVQTCGEPTKSGEVRGVSLEGKAVRRHLTQDSMRPPAFDGHS